MNVLKNKSELKKNTPKNMKNTVNSVKKKTLSTTPSR